MTGSPHDLSKSLPGVRADGESCVFCHTTHQAGREGPLWNVEPSHRVYRPYQGSEGGVPRGQPDGSSKLCLSCHDGLVAPLIRRLPAVNNGTKPLQLQPSLDRTAGDLATSHPVSTSYMASTARLQWQLLPAALVLRQATPGAAAPIDPQGRIQCTSCHDPHNNRNGNFLRLPQEGDRLCRSCHDPRGYDAAAHVGSQSNGQKMGCSTCHVSHGAVLGTAMLRATEPVLCIHCHREQVRSTTLITGGHGAIQHGERRSVQRVECSTCHDPHVVKARATWDRSFLTDPRDRMGRPRLILSEETPFSGTADPLNAYRSSPVFCLSCHDGSWQGASNIAGELAQAAVRSSEFVLGASNLHIVHSSVRAGERVGCTYCHDVHGSNGNAGVRRGAMLPAWLVVREFPYVRKQSCGSTDPAARCH
ncbi:MAG: hypothetical protein HY902_08550 [Deltaproteobacteria bacterium]|nr:hypothetical protein [Deltaproteobacteria bacterium]